MMQYLESPAMHFYLHFLCLAALLTVAVSLPTQHDTTTEVVKPEGSHHHVSVTPTSHVPEEHTHLQDKGTVKNKRTVFVAAAVPAYTYVETVPTRRVIYTNTAPLFASAYVPGVSVVVGK